MLRQLALAAVATSFVLMPETSEHDENIFKTLPIASDKTAALWGIPETAFERTLSVPCSDCRGSNTHLDLDLTVEDGTRLLLNGFELYPDADPWSGDLQASVDRGHHNLKNERLGYSLAVYPKATGKDGNMELIEVDLKIIEVGNNFVDGIPTVKVDLIKGEAGGIMMASANFEHSEETACTTIWCRAKELADKLWAQAQSLGKGCGKTAGQSPSLHDGVDDVEFDEDDSDYEHIPHDIQYLSDDDQYLSDDDEYLSYDDEYLTFVDGEELTLPSSEELHDLFKSIAGHIIMPVIMGVTTGVAIALYVLCCPVIMGILTDRFSLALCIQSMARRFTRFVRDKRNGGRRTESAKAAQNEPATSEEKSHLMV